MFTSESNNASDLIKEGSIINSLKIDCIQTCLNGFVGIVVPIVVLGNH